MHIINSYKLKKNKSNENFAEISFWKGVLSIQLDNYLWMNNNYRPKVEVKVCYSAENLFVYFRTIESEITARFKYINDLVHKDSCVEFFINLFPNQSDKYLNFEMNPLGTIYVEFGDTQNRDLLSIDDIKQIEIKSSIKTPTIGHYGSSNWEVAYKIPFTLFEKMYQLNFVGDNAKGNFYKCGDESKFEHYGCWNKIDSVKPNFHLPTYFGELIFEE